MGHDHGHIEVNERKTRWAILINFLAMLLEIGFGYYTDSMALLMDGWHMATHVLALGVALLAYYMAKRSRINTEKMYALGGYTSGISLGVVSILMAKESVERLLNPVEIKFEEALYVAAIGLVVNGLSLVILHHKEEQREHNIHAAYLHVMADLLTSILAISALVIGLFYGILWLDPVSGFISALVIAYWSVGLVYRAGRELIEWRKTKIKNEGS